MKSEGVRRIAALLGRSPHARNVRHEDHQNWRRCIGVNPLLRPQHPDPISSFARLRRSTFPTRKARFGHIPDRTHEIERAPDCPGAHSPTEGTTAIGRSQSTGSNSRWATQVATFLPIHAPAWSAVLK